jgi:ribonuclease HII
MEGTKMKQRSIKEIQSLLKEVTHPDHPFLQECRSDSRKGVVSLLNKWEKEMEKKQELQSQWLNMNKYENELRKQGFRYIAGIDEVGRGPLAGPVVAAAVILPLDFYLPGLNDSKKISEKKREEFYEAIVQQSISYGIGIIDNEEIDEVNIYVATKKAMYQAINNLTVNPDYLLIDAMKLDTPYPQESIIKGDSKSVSISAASILAKVTRDRMMKEYAFQYPQYGFEKNMGYGTKDHLQALSAYGISPLHRKSFAPIKDMIHE